MPRSNKEAQSERSVAGNQNESKASRMYRKWLEERPELDREIVHIARTVQPRYRFPGAKRDFILKPDHSFQHKRTQEYLAFGGDKKSLRERWKQDVLEAMLLRGLYPNSIYLQLTVKEQDQDDPTVVTRAQCKGRMEEVGEIWAAHFSIEDTQEVMAAKRILLDHLAAQLPRLARNKSELLF